MNESDEWVKRGNARLNAAIYGCESECCTWAGDAAEAINVLLDRCDKLNKRRARSFWAGFMAANRRNARRKRKEPNP